VTTVSDTTLFDRMIETFSKNQDILPDTGGDAPQIYFGRVLPETASLDPAGYPDGFPLTVYLLDESAWARAALTAAPPGRPPATRSPTTNPSGNSPFMSSKTALLHPGQ
jgi:hypothetical protein